MKFSKLSQLFLVSSIGLLVATLLSACLLVSIDWVFVTSAGGTGGNGTINTYAVDASSGALHAGQPAVSSGGSSPVAMAVSATYENLYVANQGTSNNVVHMAIDSNGILTQKDVVTGLGTPVSLAANQAGTFLYGIFTQASGKATLAALPLGTDGTINATSAAASVTLTIPGNPTDVVIPTGVIALDNNGAVYVSAFDETVANGGSTANGGWVFGYAVGSGGALTPAAGSPYKAGTKPSALVADPTSRFVYVADYAESQLIGYTVQSGSALSFFLSPPTRTGNEPTALTFDPRGKFLYIANQLDNTVSAFSIDLTTGTPTITVNTSAGSSNPTGTSPVGITVDPALGRFLYTANYLDNSASGFRLDPTSGSLTQTQDTPYPTAQHPTAILSIPHGNHATQSVTP